jgi:hypothetical protein
VIGKSRDRDRAKSSCPGATIAVSPDMISLLEYSNITIDNATVRSTARTVAGPRTGAKLLAALAVCGGLGAARSAAAASCEQYPVPWRASSGAHSAAQSDLSSLSPSSTMTWNNDTGTLTALSQLAIQLPGCTDGQDVGTQVLGVIAAHPQLFQLDAREWRVPEYFDCKYLVDNTIISMGRQQLAGQPVAEDVFGYTLKRVDGVVQLAAINGVYLPVIGSPTGDAMAACSTLTESAAATTARATALTANVYSQCRKTGTVTYTPKPNDVFQLAPSAAWTWEAGGGQASLTGQRTLRVTVDPSNYSPALMASAARCPAPDGDGNQSVIGFDVTFDVHTGAILNVKPGLDCVVC